MRRFEWLEFGKPVESSVGDVLTCLHISHHPSYLMQANRMQE